MRRHGIDMRVFSGLMLWVALAGQAAAGSTDGIEAGIRTLWSDVADRVGDPPPSWAESPAAVYPWARGMVERHVDTRYLARRLIRRTEQPDDGVVLGRLSTALTEWLATHASAVLHDNLARWRGTLARGGELSVQRAELAGELATARVRLRVANREWDLAVQLHRAATGWRVYDGEYAGLGLLEYLRAVWAGKRAGRALPEAIEALVAEAAAIREGWP
jgi:hypothetical protein